MDPRLPPLLTDDLVDDLAVVGRYDELGPAIVERFGTLADGVALPPLGNPGADEAVAGLVAQLQAVDERSVPAPGQNGPP
jgi:hypothetical protein